MASHSKIAIAVPARMSSGTTGWKTSGTCDAGAGAWATALSTSRPPGKVAARYQPGLLGAEGSQLDPTSRPTGLVRSDHTGNGLPGSRLDPVQQRLREHAHEQDGRHDGHEDGVLPPGQVGQQTVLFVDHLAVHHPLVRPQEIDRGQ